MNKQQIKEHNASLKGRPGLICACGSRTVGGKHVKDCTLTFADKVQRYDELVNGGQS